MSELAYLLAQVQMNGIIERAWAKAGGDLACFKQEMQLEGELANYLFEVGEVQVVDGQPVFNWPCLYVEPPYVEPAKACPHCGKPKVP